MVLAAVVTTVARRDRKVGHDLVQVGVGARGQGAAQAGVVLVLGQPAFGAWGYGRVGYGPFRVRRVLDAVPNAGARLQAAAGTAVEGRPVDGYACLGDHGIARLPYLGPAFGTKFLYFCSATSSQPALILDRLVARWLRENAGLPLNELRWSVSTYVRYLEIMFGWADELGLAADELEVCIFSTQAGGLGDSQWAPG